MSECVDQDESGLHEVSIRVPDWAWCDRCDRQCFPDTCVDGVDS